MMISYTSERIVFNAVNLKQQLVPDEFGRYELTATSTVFAGCLLYVSDENCE
ncbi:hypothetical protein KIN20_007365 [Parelaphostrongylus tenuis]|uniref:Uncharacterized protein n=1 Tax=Parelaphostrongylus tenuis TaxID=148309 RepID=A0AAD5MVG7_PARTN|nr:hypothetical protein KIN20_007365 [Parelaphostrongylus tenuis]